MRNLAKRIAFQKCEVVGRKIIFSFSLDRKNYIYIAPYVDFNKLCLDLIGEDVESVCANGGLCQLDGITIAVFLVKSGIVAEKGNGKRNFSLN